MENNNEKRRIVCMFGMARSGTSFMAHLVREMGVYLGDDKDLCLLSNLDGFNPEGIFERQDVMDINDDLLKVFGAQEEGLNELPLDWKHQVTNFKERICGVIRCMPANILCGIKNNYMSVLFPVWAEVFSEEGVEVSYIHIVRHPQNVIKSAYKAWHIEAGNTLYTWYCRNRQAMMAARYGRYKMVLYDALMEYPEQTIESLADFLGLDVDVRKVAKVINRNLCHHREKKNDEFQETLYQVLKEYGDAVKNNDYKCMFDLALEFSSYESMVTQLRHPHVIPMGLSCKIIGCTGVVYFGAANWGEGDTFSIRKWYEVPLSVQDVLLVTLATQASGKCYGAYYKISDYKVNGKECQIRIKRQPTIRDLNMQFEIVTDEKEITSIEIVGSVKIVKYPSWYRWGRKIMPLRLRDFLRAIGVRKVYGK